MSSVTILRMFVILICFYEATSAGLGTFWQVTDLHWDRLYSRTGDPNSMCHCYNFSHDNGIYGNLQCDTSGKLYRSSLKAMYQFAPNVDFILWTGDNAPHIEYPNQTWVDVFETLITTSSLLKTFFPSSLIFPVLGNHDTVPSNLFPSNDTEFYNAYLTNGNWSAFISDNTSKDTFLRGGYYSKNVNVGLKVLVINTCLYMKENFLVNETDSDPSGQMSWIQQEFDDSRKNHSKVIVTGHVAPGYYSSSAQFLNMKSSYNDRFIQLMANYSDVLMALIFGHEHSDTFRLLSNNNGEFKVPAFLAPPVTPWIPPFLYGKHAVNSGIRLYAYNASSDANIEDYYQFYLNYNEANENITNGTACTNNFTHSHDTSVPMSTCVCDEDNVTCAEWKLLYRPTQEYNISDLSTTSMVQLYYKLRESQELFNVFERHSALDYVVATCSEMCRHNFLCSMANITQDDMEKCLLTPETYMHFIATNSN